MCDTVEQKIMLQLQQRAHYSLEESRRGNTIANRYPVGSEPVSPDHDNDELAILGGKTRLVAKVELPSSPNLMERSPNSHNPIVPLPLSPTMHHHMDPSVVEYLHSFGPPVAAHSGGQGGNGPSDGSGNQMSAQQQNASFSAEVELSPVSVYGMTSMSTPTSYGAQDSLSYMSSSSPSHAQRRAGSSGHHHHHHQHHHQQHSGSSHDGGNSFCDVAMGSSTTTSTTNSVAVSSFPQYFSVFDYGSGMMNGNGAMASTTMGGGGYGDTPILDTSSPSGGGGAGQQQTQQQRKVSGSPEGNMQSTWQDFVMGLQMST